jgi:hypothetical protein
VTVVVAYVVSAHLQPSIDAITGPVVAEAAPPPSSAG